MKAGRIILLIFGVLLVVTSIGLLIGGGVIMTLENAFKDAQGFYSTNKIEVDAKSAAIVSGPADFNISGAWVRPQNLATLKIEAVNINPDKPVFIGIARTSAINSYLDGISYSETANFSTHQDKPLFHLRGVYLWPTDPYFSAHQDNLQFHTYPGADSAPAPASQSFWVASASGTGPQTLEWEITSGNYSVVLMNADSTSPIDADVSVGVKVPGVVHAVGIGLLVGEIILFLGGGVMIFFGARGW